MNEARARLYSDLFKCGLEPEVLKKAPYRIEGVAPCSKNGFIFKTNRQTLVLWIHQGREESLADQIRLMEHCRKKGFSGFLEVVPLKSGAVYGKLEDRCWFYWTTWPKMERFSYRNLDQLKAAVQLLTDFGGSSMDWAIPNYLRIVKERDNLGEKMKEAKQYLDAFGMLAAYRISPTRFDAMFLNLLSHLHKNVEEAIELLRASRYSELINDAHFCGMAINDLTRSNFRMDSLTHLRCLKLKNMHYDLRLMDFAGLLVKSGRYHSWGRNWYEGTCKEYQKTFSISEAENAIIKAFLTFPWDIYRLATRYYLNRVEWPLHYFIGKFERLQRDEAKRWEFLCGWS